MSNVGFKGFRAPEKIAEKDLDARLATIDPRGEFFVYYTGGNYGGRRASARYNALRTIADRPKEFIPLTEFLRGAARATGKDSGYDPSVIRGGLALHGLAKPSVYLFLKRNAKGDYEAAVKTPRPDPALFPGASFNPGDIVFAADDAAPKKAIAAPKKKAASKRLTAS